MKRILILLTSSGLENSETVTNFVKEAKKENNDENIVDIEVENNFFECKFLQLEEVYDNIIIVSEKNHFSTTDDFFVKLYGILKAEGTIKGDLANEKRLLFLKLGFLICNYEGEDNEKKFYLKKPKKILNKTVSSVNGLKNLNIKDDVKDQLNLDDSGDELVDEDNLINDYEQNKDTNRFIQLKKETQTTRRKMPCKNCTCGLRDTYKSVDEEKKEIESIKLKADVQNESEPVKKFSCASCPLGDAYRCDSCPYLGLPPFDPGNPIKLDSFGDDI